MSLYSAGAELVLPFPPLDLIDAFFTNSKKLNTNDSKNGFP